MTSPNILRKLIQKLRGKTAVRQALEGRSQDIPEETFNMLLGRPKTDPQSLPMLNPQQQYGLQIFRPRVKSQFNEMLDNSIDNYMISSVDRSNRSLFGIPLENFGIRTKYSLGDKIDWFENIPMTNRKQVTTSKYGFGPRKEWRDVPNPDYAVAKQQLANWENDVSIFKDTIGRMDTYQRLRYLGDDVGLGRVEGIDLSVDMNRRKALENIDDMSSNRYGSPVRDSAFRNNYDQLKKRAELIIELPEELMTDGYGEVYKSQAALLNHLFKIEKHTNRYTSPGGDPDLILDLNRKRAKEFFKEVFGDDKLSLYKYRDDWNKELKRMIDRSELWKGDPNSPLTKKDFNNNDVYKDIISVLDEIIMEIP